MFFFFHCSLSNPPRWGWDLRNQWRLRGKPISPTASTIIGESIHSESMVARAICSNETNQLSPFVLVLVFYFCLYLVIRAKPKGMFHSRSSHRWENRRPTVRSVSFMLGKFIMIMTNFYNWSIHVPMRPINWSINYVEWWWCSLHHFLVKWWLWCFFQSCPLNPGHIKFLTS